MDRKTAINILFDYVEHAEDQRAFDLACALNYAARELECSSADWILTDDKLPDVGRHIVAVSGLYVTKYKVSSKEWLEDFKHQFSLWMYVQPIPGDN